MALSFSWKELSTDELADYLTRLFDIADTNGDGCLQKDEFTTLISLSGLGFDTAMVSKVFEEADVNHDGKLQRDEFLTLMLAIHNIDKHHSAHSDQHHKPATAPELLQISDFSETNLELLREFVRDPEYFRNQLNQLRQRQTTPASQDDKSNQKTAARHNLIAEMTRVTEMSHADLEHEIGHQSQEEDSAVASNPSRVPGEVLQAFSVLLALCSAGCTRVCCHLSWLEIKRRATHCLSCGATCDCAALRLCRSCCHGDAEWSLLCALYVWHAAAAFAMAECYGVQAQDSQSEQSLQLQQSDPPAPEWMPLACVDPARLTHSTGSMVNDKLIRTTPNRRQEFLEDALQRSNRLAGELCPRRQPRAGADSIQLAHLELELEVALLLPR